MKSAHSIAIVELTGPYTGCIFKTLYYAMAYIYLVSGACKVKASEC